MINNTRVSNMYMANNDSHTDNSSNETTSTADRNENYNNRRNSNENINYDNIVDPFALYNIPNSGNNIEEINKQKLSILAEKERLLINNKRNASFNNEKKVEEIKKENSKEFSEIKNNLLMIKENLDNFFVYNIIKFNKKKCKKDE